MLACGLTLLRFPLEAAIKRSNACFACRSLLTLTRPFSTEVEEYEEEEEYKEEDPGKFACSRTHWRVEIELPKYAQEHVRRLCKKVPHSKREDAWKKYLQLKRSRDAQKDFFDWGNDAITTSEKMKPLVYDELTCIAHSEFRLSKDFGIMTRILDETQSRLPESFSPTRLLDIGCGSGSASLAALELFPSFQDIVLIDGSEYMQDSTTKIIEGNREAHELSPASITCYENLLNLMEHKEAGFNMVLLDSMLSELPSNKARASATVIAWESVLPGGVLVVKEEGDRWGYHLTRCARSLILHMQTSTEMQPLLGDIIQVPDVEILAPCPHLLECPLKGNKSNWCHFAQQCQSGPTAAYHSRRRSAELFSYVVLRKPDGEKHEKEEPWNRIMMTPLKRDKHIILDLCCSGGEFQRRVYTKGKMKNDPERYRYLRKSEWGGVWPEEIQ